jgi:3-methyladenine DNA glycosylase/8-oxoguanine DNA glycosylase
MTGFLVTAPAGFNFRSTMISHGWLMLAPFDYSDDYLRLQTIDRLDDGSLVQLNFAPAAGPAIRVEVEGMKGRLRAASKRRLTELTRRIFNLDLDMTPVYRRLRTEARYRWAEQRGAGRLLRSATVWEDLVKTLMTTNTTWAGTRNMVKRITELGPQDDAGRHAFPTPAEVAGHRQQALQEHLRAGYRTAYLLELAGRIAAGELDVERWDDPALESDDVYQRLLELKGFGPYAASVMLKLMGKFDRLALDTAARSMYAQQFTEGGKPTDRQIREHYQPYAPYQGLVLWLDLMVE